MYATKAQDSWNTRWKKSGRFIIWRSVEIYRPFRTVDMKQLQGARGEIPPRATPVKHRWIAGYICVHAIIVAQPGATFTTR